MANTIKVNGKIISYTKKAVTTNTVTFSDGTVLTMTGSVANSEVIKAYLDKQTVPVPGVYEPVQNSVDLWKKVFDHAYLGGKVLNSKGVQAADGEEVFSFVDQIGNIQLPYAGKNVPLLSKAKPRYYSNMGGLVFLPNESNVQYTSNPLANSIFPRERWFIGTLSNYQIYEAFFNNTYTEYTGDLSSGGVRTKSGSDYDGDKSYLAGTPLPLNSSFLIRQVFTDDVKDSRLQNRVNVQMWINGVKVGQNLTTYKRNTYSLGVGADTNNSHWGVQGLFYKNGLVSDSDAATLTTQFMEQYNIGKPVNMPIAENIQIKRNGTTFTASYKFKGIGADENVSKRKIKWVLIYGGITFAEYIPGTDNMLSFDAAKYPLVTSNPATGKQSTYYASDPGIGVRVEITVEDTQGRAYVIPQSVAL